MNVLTEKNQIRKLTVLAIIVYFSSYITRINFGAIISEFISAENVSKPDAAVITTVAFITYGAGQVFSGILGDKFDPRKLIFYGFLLTVAMNFLLTAVAPDIFLMSVVWGINGFAQSFMWPPLVKIMSNSLSQLDYDRSVIKIAYGSAIGTISVYLLSPLIIDFAGYKYVFIFFGSFALIFSFVWIFSSMKITAGIDFSERKPARKKAEENHADTSSVVLKLLPVIALTIIIQGMLRDGISTWFPNYISEVFHMSSSKSILIAVVLPVFHLFSSLLTYRILRLMKNDVFGCISAFFGLITLLVIGLKLCGDNLIIASVVMFATINGVAHGINSLQTMYIPAYFVNTGKISTFAGILNACTYVGSAVSTYAFALISNNFGWDTTLTSWIIFAVSGAFIGIICMVIFNRGKKNNGEEND